MKEGKKLKRNHLNCLRFLACARKKSGLIIFRRLVLSVLFFLTPISVAITLQEAKQQGLVGEQNDGYLGMVVDDDNTEVRNLIQKVNDARRERYQQISQKNNIDLEQVQRLAFEQAAEATVNGFYIQNEQGRWTQK